MSKRKEPDAPNSTTFLFIVSCSICGKDESTLIHKKHLHEDSLLLLSEYPWEQEDDVCTPELLELLYHLGHECVVQMELKSKILSRKFAFHRFAKDSVSHVHSQETAFDVKKTAKLKVRHIHLKCDDQDGLLEEAKSCLHLE